MTHEQERHLQARWRFLDGEKDACCVVTRRMEVLYLNAAARSLVPERWFGSRCWDVFPVGEKACARNCPAVRWVATSAGDGYCEEVLSVDGRSLVLGVAVLLLDARRESPERGLLVLRPRGEADPEGFRGRLLANARRLRARADERAPSELHGTGSAAPAAKDLEPSGNSPPSPDPAAPGQDLTPGA